MKLKHSTNFKIELLKRGLSQVEVASKLGISKQYLCDIVQGRRCPQPLVRRMVTEIGLPKSLFPRLKEAA